MTRIGSAIALVAMLAAPVSVRAQEKGDAWGGRGMVTFAAGVQTESPVFGYNYSAQLWDRNARASLDTPGRNGASFEIGGAVRLAQNFGVGMAYSRYNKERTATLKATVPSPVPGGNESTAVRQIPLQRDEEAIHLQLMYRIPVVKRLQVGVFGGPTYFRCLDDAVPGFGLDGDLTYNYGPGDFDPNNYTWTVRFREVAQAIHKDTAWGYNGGADITYMASRRVGVGVAMRYSRASHTSENPFSDTTSLSSEGVWGGQKSAGVFTMKHGGMQWSGGISFRF